jgi:preprotein translocase subunit YajC
MHRILIALLLAGCTALFAEANGGPQTAPAPAPAEASAPSTGAPPPVSVGAPEPGEKSAQPQNGAPASQQPFGGMGMLLFIAVPLVLMMFLSTRGQKKEEKRLQELRSNLKRGDAVVTIGGAHGEVAAVGEGTVDVRFGKGDNAAVVTFNKSAIATVVGAEPAKAK